MSYAYAQRIGLCGCRAAALLLLIGVSFPTELLSQLRGMIPAGAPVRVTAEAGRIAGMWEGLANDSVTIGAFERRRRTVGCAGRGALVGLVSGGLGGLVASFVVCHDGGCRSSGADFTAFAGLMFTAAGGLGGAAVGALIGSLIRVEEPVLDGDLTRLRFGLRVGF